MMKQVNEKYAVLILTEILYEKGLINDETMQNIKTFCNNIKSHN